MSARQKNFKENNLLFSDEFYSDIYEDSMVYASIVRSPVPKGRITGISTEKLPEGFSFFGWEDIPGKKTVRMIDSEIPVFCKNDITYLGQPVGIIAGPARKTARLLSKNLPIQIDEHFLYEEKEESNLLAQRTVQYGQEYKAAEDDITVEEEWESDINVQNFTETNGALCYIRAGKLYVYAPNLWISNLRRTLADVTGIDEESIFITRTNLLSKSTSVLWLNTLVCCQCAVACIKLKKPVKLEFTRTEQQIYAENTSSVKIRHRTTVGKDGIIRAMDILIHVNAGAYNPFAQEIADRLAISSTGVYKCPNLRISSNIYKSHSIPSSIDFSIIDSKAFYAIENHINKIAKMTDIDPLALRLLNLKVEDKHSKSKIILETGKSREALQALCQKSIFLRKNAAYSLEDEHRFDHDNASPYSPPMRGIALSCAYAGTGFLGSSFIKKNVSIELTYTKEKKLYIKGVPPSENIWNIWKTIASETMQIPESDVLLDTKYNIESEPENPETTDASISITSQLIKKAAVSIARKLQQKETELPIKVKKVFRINPKKSWDKESFTGYPYLSTAFAAMVIELELDLAVYKPALRGVYFIVDAGKILNPKAAETSIRNSIQEGLREIVEDDEVEAASVSIQFIQSDDPPKQIGEIVMSLLPSAYASALSQAAGKTITNMPVQTDTVYKITEFLKAKKESSAKKDQDAHGQDNAQEHKTASE